MSNRPARACFLDSDSLGPDLDFERLRGSAEAWEWHANTAPEQVAERLAGVEVAVSNKVRIDADALDAAPALRLICVAATGVNNIDLEAASARGITVCNATGYATPAVVQHVFALLLALATRLEHYHAVARDGRWGAQPFFCVLDEPITELAGCTLGIVGHGELGRGVERIARAFDMETLIAARRGRPAPDGRVDFDEVLERADAISLHCPLTDETRGLIGAAELRRMKPTAFLINTARGGIIEEAALADALRAGEIAGAGFDVLTEEPPRHGNVLLEPDIPNLIVTPHSAWGTHAARQRLVEQVAANIRAWWAGEPRNVVV